MVVIIIALVLAVTALLWWTAKPISRNHAERDAEATSRGGVTHDTKETK